MNFRTFAISVLLAGSAMAVQAQDVLTGDTRTACEAAMCLMAPGTPPRECDPALQRYYSISQKKWRDTANARSNFLNQCPKQDSGKFQDLVTKTRRTTDTDEPDVPVVKDIASMTREEMRAEVAALWPIVEGICPAVLSSSNTFRACFQERGREGCQVELEAFTILQRIMMSHKARTDALYTALDGEPRYCPGIPG